MTDPEKKETRENLIEELFLMRKVRFIAGLSIAVWGLIFWFFGMGGFNPKGLLLTISFLVFINQPYGFVIRRIKSLNWILQLHQIIDVFLVTICIYYLGGAYAYFAIIIYSILIIFAAVIISKRSALVVATLCSLCYLILFRLEYQGFIPKTLVFKFGFDQPLSYLTPIFICLSLFLLGYVSSFLADIIYKKGEQSRQALERLKQAEDAMVQSEKLAVVGQFASGVIHEIKNPLGVILSGTEFLEKEVSDRADIILAVNKIRQSAIRVNEIVKDLLNFSRPSEQQLEHVNLNNVLYDYIGLFKEVVHYSGVQVVKELSKAAMIVRINNNQFEQVVLNILINACDAMPNGGKIFLRTFTDEYKQKGLKSGFRDSSCFVVGEKVAVLEIQDEGTGMPQEVINKVFDPFFTTKQKKENVGLGLSICRKIIEAHKGEIEIRSVAGQGTIVIIRLPLFEEKKTDQEMIVERYFK